jgi:hypothetical protein
MPVIVSGWMMGLVGVGVGRLYTDRRDDTDFCRDGEVVRVMAVG